MSNACPECKVSPGEHHQGWCYSEVCAKCGYSLSAQCRCRAKARIPWTGEGPAVKAAREFGFWCREWFCGDREDGFLRHARWEECGPNEIGAREDLNSVNAMRLVWSRKMQRWLQPTGSAVTWWKRPTDPRSWR